jgi:hypothetical protein
MRGPAYRGSAANAAAIKSYNAEHGTTMAMRKRKYLNNIVEQDHRGVQRVTRPMMGCKSFDAAPSTLVGIALMPMLRKGQLENGVEQGCTAAEQFYALASSSANRPRGTSRKSATPHYVRHNSHAPRGTTPYENRLYKATQGETYEHPLHGSADAPAAPSAGVE